MSGPVWTGGFVAQQLGVSIHSDPAGAVPVEDLVGLALRRNPKRAHLLVSRVLAKHVPTEPGLVIAAGELLGAFVAHALSAQPSDGGDLPAPLANAAATLTTVLRAAGQDRQEALALLAGHVAGLRTTAPDAVVIGYAETATGLGRLVANALGAYYIHSTRHATPTIAPVAGFEEGHSHATSHSMTPSNPGWLDGDGPIVLVDDEFSTGSTVINTIRELHALAPHAEYVVAALIDLRSAADRARFDALAAELGASISVTALGTGEISLGEGILDRAAALIAQLPPAANAVGSAAPAGRLSMLELTTEELTAVRSDRFGNARPPASTEVAAMAGHVADMLATQGCQGPLVVLGCEENMYLPLAVAHALEDLLPELEVRFSTTTRSPIVPIDRADYAISGALGFASHDITHDGPGIRFAYNLTGADQRQGTIVVFPEPGIGRRDVLHSDVAHLASLPLALTAAADDVVVVLLPADIPVATTQSEIAP